MAFSKDVGATFIGERSKESLELNPDGTVFGVGVGGQSVKQVELLGRLRDLLAEVDVVDGFIRDRARAEVGGSVVSCEVFEIPRHVQDKINESFVRGEVDRAGR